MRAKCALAIGLFSKETTIKKGCFENVLNMVSNKEKWIRIFDIPDVSKHKNGFTVYKVISMVNLNKEYLRLEKSKLIF